MPNDYPPRVAKASNTSTANMTPIAASAYTRPKSARASEPSLKISDSFKALACHLGCRRQHSIV